MPIRIVLALTLALPLACAEQLSSGVRSDAASALMRHQQYTQRPDVATNDAAEVAAGNSSSRSSGANSSSTASPDHQAANQTTNQTVETSANNIASYVDNSDTAAWSLEPTHGRSNNSCLDGCSKLTYTRGTAADDLKAICKSQAYLTGCSLHRMCTQGIDPVSISKTPTTVCDQFTLLATICGLDSLTTDQKGCSAYRSTCMSPQPVVQQCNSSQGLRYLVPTAAARQLSRIICEGPGSGLDTCKRCDWTLEAPACDLLIIYGALCVDSPDMNECSVWQNMCTADPSLYVCRQQLPGGRPGPDGIAPQLGPTVSAAPAAPAPTSAANSSRAAQVMTVAAVTAVAVLL